MRGAAAESSPSRPRAKIPLSDGKCIRTFSATEGTLFFHRRSPDGFGVTAQRAEGTFCCRKFWAHCIKGMQDDLPKMIYKLLPLSSTMKIGNTQREVNKTYYTATRCVTLY